jgi:hypothetical protein
MYENNITINDWSELMEISLINEMDLFVCCNEWMEKVSDERCQLFRVQNSYLTRKVRVIMAESN